MSEQAPAGWYPDPEKSGQSRYYDGQQWTDQFRNDGGFVSGPDEPAAGSGPPAASSGPSGPPPGAGVQSGGSVDPWLWQSIVATLLCCLPFGIVGIINASKSNSAAGIGDMATARKHAADAKKWTLIAVGSSAVFFVLWLLLFFGSFATL